MTIALAIIAGTIFLLYSVYFINIIKGDPQSFELEMTKALANWMIFRGEASKGQIWLILLLSVILEAIYFTLVFLSMDNFALFIFTSFFLGVELYHILRVFLNFRLFFQGKLMIKDVFDWRLERASTMLFFTHSILVLISIIFF